MISLVLIISILCFLLLIIKGEKPPCDSYECNTEDPTHWGLLYAHVAIPSKFYECTPFGLELFDCPDVLIFPICGERCDFPDSTATSPSTTTTARTTTPGITSEQTTLEPPTPEPTPEPTTQGTTDWIVIQRRGSQLEAGETRQDFYLPWVNYTNGFGDRSKDFWLGLERISDLTINGDYELGILMTTIQGATHKVSYDTFKVSSSSDNYRLTIGGFHGNIWNAMAYHNGQRFSTRDRDNDNYSGNCATAYAGAWWYDSCFHANLNGMYIIDTPPPYQSVRWYDGNSGHNMFMRFTEMKIRPRIK